MSIRITSRRGGVVWLCGVSDLLAEGLASVAHLADLVGAHEGADRQGLTAAPDTTIHSQDMALARLIPLLFSTPQAASPHSARVCRKNKTHTA